MTHPADKYGQTKPDFTYEPARYQDKAIIFIHFTLNKKLYEQVKKLKGVRWSPTRKAWYVPDIPFYREQFGLEVIPAWQETLLHIHPVNQPAFRAFVETLQLKAYSENTIRTYRNEFAQLLFILKSVSVDSLDAARLRSYFLYCTNYAETLRKHPAQPDQCRKVLL